MANAPEFTSQLLTNAIELRTLDLLSTEIDKWFVDIDALKKIHGDFGVAERLPSEAHYLPTASSIALNAVIPPEKLIDAFSPLLKERIVSLLGAKPLCDINIAWLRRQYPESMKAAIARPHGWHQDGAYGVDFMDSNDTRDESLLPMITAWLPLHHCGETAPGIELIQDSPQSVLPLSQLDDKEIQKQWPKNTYWQPVMKPGDALLIASQTIHRTFSTDSMTQLRGCVELRFLPSSISTKRLAGHQYIECF